MGSVGGWVRVSDVIRGLKRRKNFRMGKGEGEGGGRRGRSYLELIFIVNMFMVSRKCTLLKFGKFFERVFSCL